MSKFLSRHPIGRTIGFMARLLTHLLAPSLVAPSLLAVAAHAQGTFVNFESPQSHPIDVTPDGAVLVACNTADGVLEVFDLVGGLPQRRGAVAVGVDPVSVRVRLSLIHI